MKKSNVKRFDMGGYTAGMEAMGRRAADDAQRAAKKARRDEQIALDKADAIEEFAPEKYLIPGMAARRAIPAALRAGADILRNEFMGPQTSEGLPTAQRLRDVRSRVAPGRLVRNKADMERIAGYRNQYKPGTSNTRNAKLRGEAEEMGIPYKDYLKGKSKAERASMGLEAEQTSTNAMDRFKKGGKVGKVMGEFKSGSLKSSSGQKVTNRKQAMAIAMSEAGKSMKTKKYAAGGKTDKRSFSSGDVFSNYDVGADPFLKSRKGGTFTDKEMKDGLTKDEIMRKTTPKTPKAKYAAGGNVNNMAGMRQNPIGQMKQAANLVNTVKSEAAKRGMIPVAMGALRGMGGGMGLGRAAGTGGFNTSGLGNAAVNAGKGMFGMKKGGKVGESKAMVKKEVEFFKKKGAPKSMIKHEMGEAKGMKRGGGKMMKFAKGGSIDGCAVRGKTKLPRGGK